MGEVTVSAPSRLHLGMIDLGGTEGRVYGGLGVALKKPRLFLRAREAKILVVEGERRDLVKGVVKRFLQRFKIGQGVHIKVIKTIPEHVGLGSTTQLVLGVGQALAELFGIEMGVREIGRLFGRGEFSGVGTATFEYGGFVVEGGHKVGRMAGIPPLIFRSPLPKDWMFVVAIPRVRRGLDEKEESLAFKSLPPAPDAGVERVCRLILVKMLPSLVEEDIVGFGGALTEIQRIVGSYFKSSQNGVFAHPVIGETVEFMLREGATGCGQSSWGPAVYGMVEGRKAARSLAREVRDFLAERGGGEVFFTNADNRGANSRRI